MAYRTFQVHAHLMHLSTRHEGRKTRADKEWESFCRAPNWQNLRLLVSEVSSAPPCQQHFFIKQHQRLVINLSAIIPHGEHNGWIRRRRARLWDGYMFRMGLGVGWQLSLTFGNSMRLGWAFSSWSRADYWQHYIIKMSKCSTSLLEHK